MERTCDSLLMCIVTVLSHGLRSGGGVGDVLRKPSKEVRAPLTEAPSFVPTHVFVQHLQLRRWTREPAVSQSRSEFSLFSELWEISQPFPTLCGNEAAKLKQISSVLMISTQDVRTIIQRKHTRSTL